MNSNLLKEILNSGVIYLDSRFINDKYVNSFLSSFAPIIKRNKCKIGLIIPTETKETYDNITLNDDKSTDLSSLFYIHYKLNFDCLHPDHIKSAFKTDNTLFITQDQMIAFEASNRSKDSNKVYVRRVSNNSLLESFPMIVGDIFSNRPLFSYIHGRSPIIDKIPQDCNIPSEKSTVYIDNKPVKLKKQIGLGGEGSVYMIDNEIVAKIYNKEKLTKTRVDKISTMVNKRINDYSICWPISEVRNKENFVVGYTMKKVEGNPISTLYRGPLVTMKLYPDYKPVDSIDLCITILQKIEKLHKNNVLLGDINDRNFFINNLKDVFLIDTDSYQLEDYSCEVGTIGYIAPELKHGVLSTSLRTFEDEGYAVAVFVFRTLMQGYFPFAQIGTDSDYVQLIKKQDFPYTLKDKKTKKKVPSQAFDCWSKFPSLLKKMFIQTFMYDKDAIAQNRYSVEQWIIILEQYKEQILSE